MVNNYFNCDMCNKSYKHRQSLWNHKQKIHGTTNDTLSNIVKKNKINNNQSNQCEYCLKTYSRKDNLKVHQRTCKGKVNNNQSNQCEYSLKTYSRKDNLKVHQRTCKGKVNNNQ